MAIKLASDDEDFPETHDINVTPFIDVVLVLLIIFMVAAPLSTVDSNIDLPASNAARQTPPQEPVYVTLNKDLSLQIDDMRVDRSALGAMLNMKTNGDKDRRIFLRADKSASYGDLMNVMNLLRDGGYLKIGLIGLEVGGGAMK